MNFDPISHLSTEYVRVVVHATLAGSPVDVTPDPVEFAFVASAGSIDTADWNAGLWEVNTVANPPVYTALCLVGPNGVTLDVGDYAVWIRVTDNPEVPVKCVPGTLSIT